MANGTDDAQLVEECRRGDLRAFEVLVYRYQKPVFNVVYRMVRDREDARDLTQGTFLKAFQQLGSFDPRFKFYSWIYRIAINESLNHVKRAGRQEPLEDDRASAGPGPDEDLAGLEMRRQVQDAVMTVKPDHRIVLVLRHFLDCSYQDIAEILGVPEKTVKSRLFSARQELRSVLEGRGVLR